MKKIKIITGFIAAVAAAVSLTACGSSASEFEGTSTVNISVPAKDYNGFYRHTADVYKDYVTLGDYNNIEIEEIDRSDEDITDEEIDNAIKSIETEFTEQEDITEDGTTQDGDIITLDFSGSIDGKEFDGGTATDQTYTVGSLGYIEDLDEGLKGKKAGEEYDIPVKFPDDYHSEELKGKDAVFKVKITNITRPNAPVIDDAWVSAHSADLESKGYGKVTTLADLKEAIKTSQKESAITANNNKILSAALVKLKESSEFKGYPEAEVSKIESNVKNNIESEYDQYKQYMDMMSSGEETSESSEGETEATTTTADAEAEFLEYLQQTMGLSTREEFDEYCHNYAQDYVENKMLVTLIAADQGFTASVDEIVEKGEEYAEAYKSYGYKDYQDIIDKHGAEINCEMGYDVIYSKVADFMSGKVKMVPAQSTESTENTETEESKESTEATEKTEDSENKESEETTTAQN